jgi:hypothetical protein
LAARTEDGNGAQNALDAIVNGGFDVSAKRGAQERGVVDAFSEGVAKACDTEHSANRSTMLFQVLAQLFFLLQIVAGHELYDTALDGATASLNSGWIALQHTTTNFGQAALDRGGTLQRVKAVNTEF